MPAPVADRGSALTVLETKKPQCDKAMEAFYTRVEYQLSCRYSALTMCAI